MPDDILKKRNIASLEGQKDVASVEIHLLFVERNDYFVHSSIRGGDILE